MYSEHRKCKIAVFGLEYAINHYIDLKLPLPHGICCFLGSFLLELKFEHLG